MRDEIVLDDRFEIDFIDFLDSLSEEEYQFVMFNNGQFFRLVDHFLKFFKNLT